MRSCACAPAMGRACGRLGERFVGIAFVCRAYEGGGGGGCVVRHRSSELAFVRRSDHGNSGGEGGIEGRGERGGVGGGGWGQPQASSKAQGPCWSFQDWRSTGAP